MNVLKRFVRGRRVLVGAMVLAMVATAGGLAGFVSPAGADLTLGTPSPVTFCGLGPDLCLLPGGAELQIAGGTTGPAAAWVINVGDSGAATANLRWNQGDSIFITVSPNGTVVSATAGANSNATPATANFVAFAGASPPAVIGASCSDSGATVPVVTSTWGTYSKDPANMAGLNDVLKLTFTNSNATPGISASATCSLPIPFISYQVGADTNSGDINVQASYTFGVGPVVTIPAPTPTGWTLNGATAYPPATGSPNQSPFGLTLVGNSSTEPNASVENVFVTANVPPVSVQPNAINAPISPVAIYETQFGQLLSGTYVCVTLQGGSTWSSAGGPTFTASGGTGAVTAVPVSGGGTATLVGEVTTASTTDPGAVFTFNNLEVNSNNTIGQVVAIVTIDSNIFCGGGVIVQRLGDTTNYGQVVVFTIGQVSVNAPIYGSNADQTAVAALEFRYPATPHTNCLPNNAPPSASQHDVGSSVVLATDQNWPDALTASYLAAYLRTGVLLTPTGSLSPYTELALAQEGVSSVFIVGGNLAVSDGVANQLAGTQQYQCGGTVPRTDAEANPLNLNVTRIWGPTADDTAQDVSTFVNSGYVRTLNISGVPLYNGLGSNPYNNTSGKDSTDGAGAALPTTKVRTAILATDQSFQDAAAISSMAYWGAGSVGLPILITPPGGLGSQALTGLLDLGIQQVIEPGGPVAISDAVNSTLGANGIAVIRLAGQDASDTSTQIARFELGGYPGALSPESTPGGPISLAFRNATGNNPDGLGWTSGECAGDDTSGTVNADQTELACPFTAALARGDFYADAITSSVVTGSFTEPILLTEDPNTLGAALTTFFNQAGSPFGIDPNLGTPITPIAHTGSTVSAIQPFGGPAALAASTIQAALNAISAGA